MDLIVPDGMGGGDAVNKLIEIDPETKVIVSSGNVDDPILRNFEEYGISAFLLKPFKIDSLRKTLHEVTMGNMNSGVVSWFYKDN
jgi:DNA-binding NarL/FixJ family response regulator